MPRDILSRSGSRPQQQLQPALLPDKKGGQRLLEGGPPSANSIFTPTPPTLKQYGLTARFTNRASRSSRGGCGQRPYRSRQPAHPRSPRRCPRFSFVPALVRSVSRQNLLLRFWLVGKRERTALRKVPPFGLSSPWDNLSRTCLKWGTPGPYVWPVKRQQVAARRSLVLCGGPKRQAASLSLADRGRGAGRFPHSRRWCWSLVLPWEKSPRTRRPAPRVHPGPPAIQLWRRKNFLSYTTRKFGWISETVQREFFQKLFHVLQPALQRSAAPRSYQRPRPGQPR